MKRTIQLDGREIELLINEALQARFGNVSNHRFFDKMGQTQIRPAGCIVEFEDEVLLEVLSKEAPDNVHNSFEGSIVTKHPLARKEDLILLGNVLIARSDSLALQKSIYGFLSNRCLKFVWQLVVLSDQALLKVNGIGEARLLEIHKALRKLPNYDENFRSDFTNLFSEWVKKEFKTEISELGLLGEVQFIANLANHRLTEGVHKFILAEVPKMK